MCVCLSVCFVCPDLLLRYYYFSVIGRQGPSMVKRTRDDAVYVTGISFDTPIEKVQELFGSVGTIRVSRSIGGVI